MFVHCTPALLLVQGRCRLWTQEMRLWAPQALKQVQTCPKGSWNYDECIQAGQDAVVGQMLGPDMLSFHAHCRVAGPQILTLLPLLQVHLRG